MQRQDTYTMLKRHDNLKYKLIFDSLLVGIAVGLVIVTHRIRETYYEPSTQKYKFKTKGDANTNYKFYTGLAAIWDGGY